MQNLKRLRRQNFELIETELVCYPSNRETLRREVQRLEECITLPSGWPRIERITVAYQDGTGGQYEEVIYSLADYHQQGVPSDPTAVQADKLWRRRLQVLSGTAMLETMRRMMAIEEVLKILEADAVPNGRLKLKLVEMRYWRRTVSDEQVAHELSVSMRTFRRWRREVVCMIAERLGWVV